MILHLIAKLCLYTCEIVWCVYGRESGALAHIQGYVQIVKNIL